MRTTVKFMKPFQRSWLCFMKIRTYNLEKRVLGTSPCSARNTHTVSAGHTGQVQGKVFSRKAQLINCWLVSREDDRVEPDLWTSTQTLSVAPKIPNLLPDNIIQSKYSISIL